MTTKWGSKPVTIPTHDLGFYVEVDKSTAGCKHGSHSCEICGTTTRHTHKTVGGRGIVGRIKR